MKERDSYLKMVRHFRTIDVETTPSWILMTRLINHPSILYPNRVEVAASLKIDVSEAFINDTELVSETVLTYVHVLNSIWKLLDKKNPYDVSKNTFMAIVKNMSITYTYED